MEIAGEYTFEAPQELVWRALQDPEVLASVMPGGEDFKEVGENEYEGKLNVRVGPVMGKFAATIKLSDIVELTSYNMVVDGNGAAGFVKASGRMELTRQGDSTTMVYDGDAQVGGRIASVGQRLLDASAKSIIRQSLEGLNGYLKIQHAAESTADAAGAGEGEQAESTANEPVPEYKPPSQAAVAANVAKDVAGDLVPPKYRPVLIGIAAIAIVVILYLVLT
jgi:carbon monoxide dehydrogenase subunit G